MMFGLQGVRELLCGIWDVQVQYGERIHLIIHFMDICNSVNCYGILRDERRTRKQ